MLGPLKRFFFTLALGLFGVWLALPVSYFFQGAIYRQMSWYDYVSGGFGSVFIGADFGSVAVYRYSAYACAIISVALGHYVIWRWSKRKK